MQQKRNQPTEKVLLGRKITLSIAPVDLRPLKKTKDFNGLLTVFHEIYIILYIFYLLRLVHTNDKNDNEGCNLFRGKYEFWPFFTSRTSLTIPNKGYFIVSCCSIKPVLYYYMTVRWSNDLDLISVIPVIYEITIIFAVQFTFTLQNYCIFIIVQLYTCFDCIIVKKKVYLRIILNWSLPNWAKVNNCRFA
jgi:hypothetical protein